MDLQKRRLLLDEALQQSRDVGVQTACLHSHGRPLIWLLFLDGHRQRAQVACPWNGYLLGEAAALAETERLADRFTFQQDDAVQLKFPDHSVDASLSFTVMEEVDADRMLSEMIRVTKPGGRIGVVARAADMAW